MVAWISFDLNDHPFNQDESEAIKKTMIECKEYPDEVYKDVVIIYLTNIFQFYPTGGITMVPKQKELIKTLLAQLHIQIPDNFDSFPFVYQGSNVTPERTLALNNIKKALEKLAKEETLSLPATPVSAPVLASADPSLSVPEYIKTYNNLATTGKPVSKCACNHKICIEYNTLLSNNFIRTDVGDIPTTGCHSVIIFKSKKSPAPGDTKFWSLLGKEKVKVTIKTPKGPSEPIMLPMLNTIGGKLDHPSTLSGSVNCNFCIIQNMIREINEEAKLSFPSSSTSTPYQGNMNEQIFNSIFKKEPSMPEKTDYDDYYLLVRGGTKKIDSTGKYDLSYVFIGLFPYEFDEESLKRYIMDRNRFIGGVHYTSPRVDSSLREMYYLNLVRWNYSLYDDPKNKSDGKSYYGSELPSSAKTYSPPDDSDYLLPYSELKTLYSRPNSGAIVGKYGIFITQQSKNIITAKWKKPYFQPDKDYISFYAAGSLYSNTYPALKSLFDQVIGKGKLKNLSNFPFLPVITASPITSIAPAPASSIPSGVSKVRILSLDQVYTEISNPSDNSIYIINGGSFNPPHFGHIGLFELAYQAIQADSKITKTLGQKYYGVMVLAPGYHIKGKMTEVEVSKNAVLSLNARVKLCQLTIDDYPWKDPSQFGPQNMIVVNKDEYDPMRTIIGVQNLSKKQNMYYLCGSDFYFDQKDSKGKIKYGHYGAQMNMIYSIRESSLNTTPDPYDGKGGFKRIRITESEYKDMSSTKVRQNILTLELTASFNSPTTQAIIKNIGKGSYCYLGNMPYLIPKNYYHLQDVGCTETLVGGGSYTNKRKTLKNNKSKSRKIKKLALRSISTTRFTKKKHHLKHSHNKKHKTRRSKH
jgi:nicotinic acid mononucleotide adenylyltransferase